MEPLKAKDLIEPAYVKVKDILPGKSGYNLHLKVVSKNVLIDIVRLDKTRVVIADFIIGDETGIIKMRLRNENFVDLIKENETITIRNCKVPVVNNHMRMQVDAFGKIENSKDIKISDVKMDKDLSAFVYDNYSQNNRKRFDGGSDRYDGNNRNNRNNRNNNDRESFRDDRSQNTYSYTDGESVNTFLSSQVGTKN